MGKYFGTDGFRGEANKDLTFEHAILIGRYLGWYYGANQGKKAKIVIGKDTRRSSYMFEYALCTGLMASGADAYIMHVTTTPSVAYITRVADLVVICVLGDIEFVNRVDGIAHIGQRRIGLILQQQREILLPRLQNLIGTLCLADPGENLTDPLPDFLFAHPAIGQITDLHSVSPQGLT